MRIICKNAVCADIKHTIETSIIRAISGQSTQMVKGCMNIIMVDMVDTVCSIGQHWASAISSEIIQGVYLGDKYGDITVLVIRTVE